MVNKIIKLKQKLITHSYQLHSRVHPIKYAQTPSTKISIKRDDELSFSISGSKLRKYASLVPHLLQENSKQVIVIGGAYSNNVVGITQLLIEHDIKPTLFLLGDASYPLTGNFLLISLLVPTEQIRWISRHEWPTVNLLAEKYIKKIDEKILIIPEGVCMPEALPGALTLALDICDNEQEIQKEFQHVFIDAGTGLTAIATILAFAWLNKPTKVEVLLLADTPELFLIKLQQFKLVFENLLDDSIDDNQLTQQFNLHLPQQARSFGAVNATIFKTIKEIARTEGFFTDPVYSAKLLLEAKRIIAEQALQGNVLIVHSGGGLSLLGFQEELRKLV